MITATLQEAKAKLHKLVEAAQMGEEVVLLRGSEVVARLQKLSEKDLEIVPQLTDDQAERFWKEIKEDPSKKFPSPGAAVSFLKKSKKS